MTPARARTRRRLAGVAASLAVHGALLLAFMSVSPRLITLPRLPSPPEPVVKLELAHPARGAAASQARSSPRPPRGASSENRPLQPIPNATSRPGDLQPLPAAPAPRASPGAVAPAAIGGSGPGDGRWRVQDEGGSAAAPGRALARSTIGCGAAQRLRLTADARDHCDAEFLRGMRTLRVDAIPAAKRAYYDEVVARTEAARYPATYDTLHQHQHPAFEPARDHGLDAAAEARCFFRFGPGAKRANRDDPCRLRLPLSPLTAETRVPPPPSLADRIADARAAAKLDAPTSPAPPPPGSDE